MHREDFPLLVNHPDIVYLDNAATTQKPAYVIDGVADFLRNEYSNIHRGLYPLSEQSECHFYNSKKLV
jgi:cysteine desulfurase/selenocysteine lyase